ncbi:MULTISPECIES: hypothetical protein [unclassified Acinetobacter]|uniref:hypothetical protein n=1 Tax=unclassified Acinetobacter TaxID=196816 RepID=UPI0015D37E3C|nr:MULTISPECIES: hypothetical protein [unclassified Acinetobacter]
MTGSFGVKSGAGVRMSGRRIVIFLISLGDEMNELELFLAYERTKGMQRFIFMARWQSIKYKYNQSLKL